MAPADGSSLGFVRVQAPRPQGRQGATEECCTLPARRSLRAPHALRHNRRTAAVGSKLGSGYRWLRQALWLVRLPAPVAAYYLRLLLRALRLRDARAARIAAKPRELVVLCGLVGQGGFTVELGTGMGWTAGALALSSPGTRVVTLDPRVRRTRSRYLELLDPPTAARIEFVRAPAEQGPQAAGIRDGVDLLFVDVGRHTRETTRDAFARWRPVLAPNAWVAFHDYGDPRYPGVAEAVAELGLEGELHGTLFVARIGNALGLPTPPAMNE